MSFSNIALQQRERESKALRIFVACSLAGSLAFHLALLASGITKYLNRVPEIEEEPVEITLLDTPIEEIEPKEEEKPEPEPEKIEPKQEKQEPEPEPKPEPEPNITQDTTTESQISGGSQAPRLFEPIPTQPRVAPPPPVVEQPPLPKLNIPPIKPISPPVVQQPVIPEPPKPIPQPEPEPILESKLSEEFKIPTTTPVQPPIPQPKPKFTTPLIEQPSPIPQPQLQARTPREIPQPKPEPITPPIEQPSPIPQPETIKPRESTIPTTPPVEELKPIPQQDTSGLIDSLKQSQENTNISSNNTAPSLPDTSSTTSTRRRRIIGGSNIATAPSTDSGIGDGTGDSVGDGDGRAACRQCSTNYPSWARERGIEGEIIVAVSTDAQGNVTNVRLISGSGNSRLDKYHLRLANNWKLKPSSNGRKGVQINTTYRIE
jgi:TonB family protein